jgi:hypothetical protein
MTARKDQDPVEAAVERAETAEEKAAAAREKAEALAAERAEQAQALLAKAQGVAPESGIEAQTTTGAAGITGDPNTSQSGTGGVTITLAHPLPLDALQRVNIGGYDRDLGIGDTITVRPEVARSLIGAGYAAGIDPENPAAVRAALAGS